MHTGPGRGLTAVYGIFALAATARAGVQLIRAVRDQGVTIIMVEHVMEVLLPLIDRAVENLSHKWLEEFLVVALVAAATAARLPRSRRSRSSSRCRMSMQAA